MKKKLSIALGTLGIVAIPVTLVFLIGSKHWKKTENNEIKEVKKEIKVKSNLNAKEFGWEGKQINEVENEINKKWILENKENLFYGTLDKLTNEEQIDFKIKDKSNENLVLSIVIKSRSFIR